MLLPSHSFWVFSSFAKTDVIWRKIVQCAFNKRLNAIQCRTNVRWCSGSWSNSRQLASWKGRLRHCNQIERANRARKWYVIQCRRKRVNWASVIVCDVRPWASQIVCHREPPIPLETARQIHRFPNELSLTEKGTTIVLWLIRYFFLSILHTFGSNFFLPSQSLQHLNWKISHAFSGPQIQWDLKCFMYWPRYEWLHQTWLPAPT